MERFNFKELELKQEGSWLQRTIRSNHFQKTIIYSLIGVLVGYALFYFGQDAAVKSLWSKEATQNVLVGLGIGLFITNSPCARGRC